jgi:hypothetical protein
MPKSKGKAGSLVMTKAAKGKKVSSNDKLRIGILVGKDFDPVKKGSHWPEFPERLMFTDQDWGKYSVDAATAVKMQQLHPDLLEIDIMTGKEITEKRLQKNHVNINFWYDVGVAMLNGPKSHIDEVVRCHRNPENRLSPSWDYYDWVLKKPRYLRALKKAGIPTIPTVIYEDGFDPKRCLKDVQKQGWEKFFVKVGHYTFFGAAAVHGRTADFLDKRAKDLETYAAENKNSKVFLIQPYMLKPNGEVFDEVRNFFINGEWRYSVFTHGTDESDAGYYEEPDGPRKTACKDMAERVIKEVLKASTWQGRRSVPLLNRIDIGVIPKKGGDSLHRSDNQYFVNEIELTMTTWLDRYSPISVQDVMAEAAVKHSLQLTADLLRVKAKIPNRAAAVKAAKTLNNRIGPIQGIKIQ